MVRRCNRALRAAGLILLAAAAQAHDVQVSRTQVPRIAAPVYPVMPIPMAQMHYFSLTGFTVTISSQSDGSTNLVVVTPPSGTDCNLTDAGDGEAVSTLFDCPAQGRLRYIGTPPMRFHVAATFSFQAATANDVFVIAVAKNGTVLQDSRALVALGLGITHGASIHAFPELATGDYIEIIVGNTTAGRNMTAKTLQLFAMGME